MDITNKEHNAVEFKKIVVPKTQALSVIEFNDCTFSQCVFQEMAFRDCKFHRCVFKKCDLSLAKLDGTVFTETKFEDCKLLGINWTTSAWGKSKVAAMKPVDFTGCSLNYNVFMGMSLRRVVMTQCTALDVGFEDANLSEADCRETDFAGSRFSRTDLTGADFRRARNYSISPLSNKIKGAKFTLPEAMSLLDGLGIVLEDGG